MLDPEFSPVLARPDRQQHQAYAKTCKSTYRFLLLLQQIETVLKLEIVYSWLAIVIVASALNGDVDTDGLD